MDKLAEQLRHDAEAIEVEFSAEFERRLTASLSSAEPLQRVSEPARRSSIFWWASSLTGATAAILMMVLINEPSGERAPETADRGVSPVPMLAEGPRIDWQTESAMLIGPLQQELDALQSDIKKAEQKVKQEIGL